jgi:hypothetical protein
MRTRARCWWRWTAQTWPRSSPTASSPDRSSARASSRPCPAGMAVVWGSTWGNGRSATLRPPDSSPAPPPPRPSRCGFVVARARSSTDPLRTRVRVRSRTLRAAMPLCVRLCCKKRNCAHTGRLGRARRTARGRRSPPARFASTRFVRLRSPPILPAPASARVRVAGPGYSVGRVVVRAHVLQQHPALHRQS